jgi:hypothetical protein
MRLTPQAIQRMGGAKLVRITGYGPAKTHLTLDGVNPICNAAHCHAMRQVDDQGVTCQGCRDAWPATRRRLNRLFRLEA